MNAAAPARPAFKPTNRVHFEYLDADSTVVLSSISAFGLEKDADVLCLIGNPEWASYEWALLDEHGNVLRHSNCGYGISAVALRDGLIAVLGLPEETPTCETPPTTRRTK